MTAMLHLGLGPAPVSTMQFMECVAAMLQGGRGHRAAGNVQPLRCAYSLSLHLRLCGCGCCGVCLQALSGLHSSSLGRCAGPEGPYRYGCLCLGPRLAGVLACSCAQTAWALW